MHPEVVRDRPCSCPICGMALEPRTATAGEPANPELVDMTRRFWIGLALTAPLLALAMSDLWPGQPVQRAIPPRWLAWLQLGLATPVVLWAGWPFFTRAYASIVNRSPNMFTLIALGVGTAKALDLLRLQLRVGLALPHALKRGCRRDPRAYDGAWLACRPALRRQGVHR